MKRRRVAALVLMFMILGFSSSLAFAFWDQTTREISDTEVIIGEGATLSVEKSVLPEGGRLVPKGMFKGANDIDEYIFTYTVYFNKEGRLQVSIDESSVQIGTQEHSFNDLAVFQIYQVTPEHNDAVLSSIFEFPEVKNEDNLYALDVMFKVFIKSPNNSDDYASAYAALSGEPLNFTITFEALELEN